MSKWSYRQGLGTRIMEWLAKPTNAERIKLLEKCVDRLEDERRLYDQSILNSIFTRMYSDEPEQKPLTTREAVRMSIEHFDLELKRTAAETKFVSKKKATQPRTVKTSARMKKKGVKS